MFNAEIIVGFGNIKGMSVKVNHRISATCQGQSCLFIAVIAYQFVFNNFLK